VPRGNFLSTNQKHYQDLGSAHHQYGISALVTQTPLCEGSSGDLAKHQLFSQATSYWTEQNDRMQTPSQAGKSLPHPKRQRFVIGSSLICSSSTLRQVAYFINKGSICVHNFLQSRKNFNSLSLLWFSHPDSLHTWLKKRCQVKHANDGQCDTMELWEDGGGKFVTGFHFLIFKIFSF